jgi:cysteine synthase
VDDGPAFDEDTIFETPLLDLEADVAPTVYGKAEWFNLYDAPYGGGSIKSRIAKGMLDAADPDRCYRPDQYENLDSPGTHERTTAPEIYEQTGGAVTCFVAGVGTGGTVTGTGRGLGERDHLRVDGEFVVGTSSGAALAVVRESGRHDRLRTRFNDCGPNHPV